MIHRPIVDLYYEVDICAKPEHIWPWIKQMGYHRAGWYIDTWWDEMAQTHLWPRIVPKEARGTYQPPADEILPEYQSVATGDIVPDGPPGSAYYEIVEMQACRLLLLHATTHFVLADGAHQRHILQGIKRRVEKAHSNGFLGDCSAGMMG